MRTQIQMLLCNASGMGVKQNQGVSTGKFRYTMLVGGGLNFVLIKFFLGLLKQEIWPKYSLILLCADDDCGLEIENIDLLSYDAPGCNLTVRKYTTLSSFHWLISLSFILSTIWHAGASYPRMLVLWWRVQKEFWFSCWKGSKAQMQGVELVYVHK